MMQPCSSSDMICNAQCCAGSLATMRALAEDGKAGQIHQKSNHSAFPSPRLVLGLDVMLTFVMQGVALVVLPRQELYSCVCELGKLQKLGCRALLGASL